MFGRLGPMELGVILFIALLIFGPRQIPKLGKSLGDSIRSFRNAGEELRKGWDEDEPENKA